MNKQKYLWYLLAVITVMTVGVGFVSCGGDDDDDSSSNINADEEGTGSDNKNNSYFSCPNNKHPHAIDLGLPSGTKWACCNVGANAPYGCGGYYAWGETEENTYYSWRNYTHCDGRDDNCHFLGSDIAGTKYDVAHVKWGGSWVMPSREQMEELLKNCTSQFIPTGGGNGRIFFGPSGGTIFLTAGGGRTRDYDGSVTQGYYWSSTQDPSSLSFAYSLNFTSGILDVSSCTRYTGFFVRPVSR